jgi:hypothetical protein
MDVCLHVARKLVVDDVVDGQVNATRRHITGQQHPHLVSPKPAQENIIENLSSQYMKWIIRKLEQEKRSRSFQDLPQNKESENEAAAAAAAAAANLGNLSRFFRRCRCCICPCSTKGRMLTSRSTVVRRRRQSMLFTKMMHLPGYLRKEMKMNGGMMGEKRGFIFHVFCN